MCQNGKMHGAVTSTALISLCTSATGYGNAAGLGRLVAPGSRDIKKNTTTINEKKNG